MYTMVVHSAASMVVHSAALQLLFDI